MKNFLSFLLLALFVNSLNSYSAETGPAHSVLRATSTGGRMTAGAIRLDQSAAVTNVLGQSNGGTGYSTAANGEVLIGNGTGFTKAGLTGTTNQVNVTNGSGTITLSTPQNIHTSATPTFSGMLLSSLAAGGLAAFDGSGNFISAGLSSADIFVGNASNKPAGVAMSGDVTINNTGVTAIGSSKVTSTMIVDATITGSDIAGATITGSNIAATTVAAGNIVSGTITDTQISASAAIARSKIAAGSTNRIVVNGGDGKLSESSALGSGKIIYTDADGLPVTSSGFSFSAGSSPQVIFGLSTDTLNQFNFYSSTSSRIASQNSDLEIEVQNYTGDLRVVNASGSTLFSAGVNGMIARNIHNNGGNGNSSSPALSSGTTTFAYVSSSGVNLDSPSNITSNIKWFRVGNVVSIGGNVASVDPAAGNSDVAFSIDYSSGTNIPAYTACYGVGSFYVSGGEKKNVYVYSSGGAGSTKLGFEFYSSTTASSTIHFNAICEVN